jgi:hypothetical protein
MNFVMKLNGGLVKDLQQLNAKVPHLLSLAW